MPVTGLWKPIVVGTLEKGGIVEGREEKHIHE